MRRAKIVATLGPASSHPGRWSARWSRRAWTSPASTCRTGRTTSTRGRSPRSARPQRAAAGPSASSPTCRAQDPRRRVRRRAGRARAPAPTFTITADERRRATSTQVSTTYSGLPGDVEARRPDPGRRRPRRRCAVDRGRRRSSRDATVVEGGTHQGPQGHQPARRRGQRPGHVRQGRRRTCDGRCVRASTWSRCRSCARRPTSSRCGRVMAEEGVERPGHRQDREAAGGRASRRDHRRLRRDHGGARRPRRGAARSRRCRSVQKMAVIELAREKAKPVIVATQMLESMIAHSAPDARRGVGRRERRARRRRRADAVGRDERRAVPGRGGGDDGPRHRARCEDVALRQGGSIRITAIRDLAASKADAIARAAVGVAQHARRQVPRRVQRDGQHGAGARTFPLPGAAARVHPEPAGAQPAGPGVGRGDVPGRPP